MTASHVGAVDQVSRLMAGHATLKTCEVTSPMTFAVLPFASKPEKNCPVNDVFGMWHEEHRPTGKPFTDPVGSKYAGIAALAIMCELVTDDISANDCVC